MLQRLSHATAFTSLAGSPCCESFGNLDVGPLVLVGSRSELLCWAFSPCWGVVRNSCVGPLVLVGESFGTLGVGPKPPLVRSVLNSRFFTVGVTARSTMVLFARTLCSSRPLCTRAEHGSNRLVLPPLCTYAEHGSNRLVLPPLCTCAEHGWYSLGVAAKENGAGGGGSECNWTKDGSLQRYALQSSACRLQTLPQAVGNGGQAGSRCLDCGSGRGVVNVQCAGWRRGLRVKMSRCDPGYPSDVILATPLWPWLPQSRCDPGYPSHFVTLATSVTLRPWLPQSRCDPGYPSHVVTLATTVTLWPWLPQSRCDPGYHSHVMTLATTVTLWPWLPESRTHNVHRQGRCAQSNRLSDMELVTLFFDPKRLFVFNFHRYHSKVKKRDTVFRFFRFFIIK